MKVKEIIEEYRILISNIEILWSDCIWAFHGNREFVEKLEKSKENINKEIFDRLISIGVEPNPNTIDLLDHPFPYSYGGSDNDDLRKTKTSTLQEFKKRNSAGGANFLFVGNMCVVQIYDYWEDFYREQIAIDLGEKKDKLKSLLFGDLRLFRNAIIHNKGVATSKIEKCEILPWFKPGDIIYFDLKKMKQIFDEIENELARIERIASFDENSEERKTA